MTSRQAGALTRRAADLYERGGLNDGDLLARDLIEIAEIEARAALPTFGALHGDGRQHGAGPVRKRGRKQKGHVPRGERFQKQRRSAELRSRAVKTRERIKAGRPRVVIGGRELLRKRHDLEAAALTLEQWEQQWRARRMFIAADGEAGKRHGNETIRAVPGENGDCGLLIRLPKNLGHLSNTSEGPCLRISEPLRRNHRAGQWRNRAIAAEPLTYQITCDTDKQRWYITCSWTLQPADGEPPTIEEIAGSGNCPAMEPQRRTCRRSCARPARQPERRPARCQDRPAGQQRATPQPCARSRRRAAPMGQRTRCGVLLCRETRPRRPPSLRPPTTTTRQSRPHDPPHDRRDTHRAVHGGTHLERTKTRHGRDRCRSGLHQPMGRPVLEETPRYVPNTTRQLS